MKIIYDPVIDAAYMYFTDDKLKAAIQSSEEYDYVIFDYDDSGLVIGIEFLQVSKIHPQLLTGILQDVSRI